MEHLTPYTERGNRNSEAWYPAEAQALDDLQRRLDKDPTTGTDGTDLKDVIDPGRIRLVV